MPNYKERGIMNKIKKHFVKNKITYAKAAVCLMIVSAVSFAAMQLPKPTQEVMAEKEDTKKKEAKKVEEPKVEEVIEKEVVEEEVVEEPVQTAPTQAQNYASQNTYTQQNNTQSNNDNNINLYNAGVVNWGEHRFTWYSQNVLPGGGLDIPGRHVNDAGFVCDSDGFIVAATAYGHGTTGDSPWGAWKSYDTGVSGNTVDLYTNW